MYVCIHPTYNKFFFLLFAFLYNRPEKFIGPMLGILLLGISAGAIRPCMSAFGGDQYHPSQVSKTSYHGSYRRVLTYLVCHHSTNGLKCCR